MKSRTFCELVGRLRQRERVLTTSVEGGHQLYRQKQIHQCTRNKRKIITDNTASGMNISHVLSGRKWLMIQMKIHYFRGMRILVEIWSKCVEKQHIRYKRASPN
jgi:hypothetical protein